MSNGLTGIFKKIVSAAHNRTGQRTIGMRAKRGKGPARATGRALALTGRPSRPRGIGIRVWAVKPRKRR